MFREGFRAPVPDGEQVQSLKDRSDWKRFARLGLLTGALAATALNHGTRRRDEDDSDRIAEAIQADDESEQGVARDL